MIIWVLYDITDNKARSRIAKYCKQAGLYRVQKSVFLGELNEHEKDELELKVEDELNQETDSLYLFPMSKNELKQTVLLGQAFDKQLVTQQVKLMFI